MTEEEFLGYLQECMMDRDSLIDDGMEGETFEQFRTFEEAMLMTSSKGLVVKMANGSEFQVTVVRS